MLLLTKILSCTYKNKTIYLLFSKYFHTETLMHNLMLTYGNVPLLPEIVNLFGKKVVENLLLGSFAIHINSFIQ